MASRKRLDGTRDTEWRSGNFPAGSTIEWRIQFLSGAVQPTAFAALDVNAPSTTTFSLKAKNGAFTDPPTMTIPLTYTRRRGSSWRS